MRRRIACILGLALLIPAGLLPAGIQAAEHRTQDDQQEREASDRVDESESPWTLSLDVAPSRGFTFENVHERTEREAEYTGIFDIEDAKLDLSYQSQRFPAPEDAQPRTVNLTLTFTSVYEFRDINENGRFDLGDEVVRHLRPGGVHAGTAQEIDLPGDLRGVEVSYPLPQGGVLELTFVVTPSFEFVGTTSVLPTDVEMNVTLENMEPQGDETMFAIGSRVRGDQTEFRGSQAFDVMGERSKAVYRWNQNATVGGEETHINATTLEQRLPVTADNGRSEGVLVAATLPGDPTEHHASIEIYHVRSTVEAVVTEVTGDPLIFALGTVLTVFLVVSPAAAKLKRGSQRTFRNS